ncbi:MAG: 3-methyl-2-oxobutanoate hydroxymethyltransferase [Candidatus Omnitrophica bacterium]|nr:3-methyl-2-oxobutanoate hydroxymethyltransferase [Candidatus Omnitrophota bacterium]
MTQQMTIAGLLNKKKKKERITALTAYEYSFARILDGAGIDIILVGDSLGMVFAGYATTIPVTLEQMLYHTKAVKTGVERALVVCDMPFLSYQASVESAILNAGRAIKETGCDAVKMEGAGRMVHIVREVVASGIPVMAHIGMTPQSLGQLGGYRVQGKTAVRARQLIEDAIALEGAGAFSIVLECIPQELGEIITERLTIPTIGIGAGVDCDGQVLVTPDILGLYGEIKPRFIKQYADIAAIAAAAIAQFIEEVGSGAFPGKEQCYAMSPEEKEALQKLIQ